MVQKYLNNFKSSIYNYAINKRLIVNYLKYTLTTTILLISIAIVLVLRLTWLIRLVFFRFYMGAQLCSYIAKSGSTKNAKECVGVVHCAYRFHVSRNMNTLNNLILVWNSTAAKVFLWPNCLFSYFSYNFSFYIITILIIWQLWHSILKNATAKSNYFVIVIRKFGKKIFSSFLHCQFFILYHTYS